MQVINPGLNVTVDEDCKLKTRRTCKLSRSEETYTELTYTKVTISTVMYWYMVEAGVAQIAPCLPTLQSLAGHRSLHAVVQSLRSLISLPSTSHGSDIESDSTIELGSADAMKIHGVDDWRIKTSVKGGKQGRPMQGNLGIGVKHEVAQSREDA